MLYVKQIVFCFPRVWQILAIRYIPMSMDTKRNHRSIVKFRDWWLQAIMVWNPTMCIPGHTTSQEKVVVRVSNAHAQAARGRRALQVLMRSSMQRKLVPKLQKVACWQDSVIRSHADHVLYLLQEDLMVLYEEEHSLLFVRNRHTLKRYLRRFLLITWSKLSVQSFDPQRCCQQKIVTQNATLLLARKDIVPSILRCSLPKKTKKGCGGLSRKNALSAKQVPHKANPWV